MRECPTPRPSSRRTLRSRRTSTSASRNCARVARSRDEHSDATPISTAAMTNRPDLARLLDHSVLKPEATERDIDEGAAVVREWSIGFYCVQLAWVRRAAQALAGSDA